MSIFSGNMSLSQFKARLKLVPKGVSPFKPILFIMSDEQTPSDRELFERYRMVAQKMFHTLGMVIVPRIEVLCLKSELHKAHTPIAQSIKEKGYSLVIACGAYALIKTIEECDAYDITVPLFSVGIENEQYLPLKEKLKQMHPTQCFHGISHMIDSYTDFVAAARTIRKKAGIVSIVSDKHYEKSMYHLDKNGTQTHLKKMFGNSKTKVRIVPLSCSRKISRNRRDKLAASQIVVLLNEPGPNKHARTIGKLCSERGVTLVTLNLRSLIEGGSVGMGASSSEYARHIALSTYALLVEQVPVGSLTDRFFDESLEIRFNPCTLPEQNKNLPHDIIQAINMRSIFIGDSIEGTTLSQFNQRIKRTWAINKQSDGTQETLLPLALGQKPSSDEDEEDEQIEKSSVWTFIKEENLNADADTNTDAEGSK